jgi:hypothetical protein
MTQAEDPEADDPQQALDMTPAAGRAPHLHTSHLAAEAGVGA